MTMANVAFVAEQASASARLDDRGEFIELFLRRRRRKMGLIDAKEVFEMATAGSEPTGFGRAEVAQVQITDPRLVEAGSELALGKSRPARGGNSAGVDNKLDSGSPQLAEHGL